MTPGRVDLTAYGGDTWVQEFLLTYGEAPADLTGATITSIAESATLRRVELGAEITDAPGGRIELSVGPDGLPPDAYTYDVQIGTAAGEIATWIRGWLIVGDDIA